MNSPLIEKLRELTEGKYRYALVGSGRLNILPSNEESLFQLKSIHSYDSLTTLDYQNAMYVFNKKAKEINGRYFEYIDSNTDLSNKNLYYMGVCCLLSKGKITSELYHEEGRINDIYIYKSNAIPFLTGLVEDFHFGRNDRDVILSQMDIQLFRKVEEREAWSDKRTYTFAPSDKTSVLFVSQQFNSLWKAKSIQEPLNTVIVNNLYQGVLIPPGTQQVILEFKPFVRFSWIPQVIYSIFGTGFLFIYVRKILVYR